MGSGGGSKKSKKRRARPQATEEASPSPASPISSATQGDPSPPPTLPKSDPAIDPNDPTTWSVEYRKYMRNKKKRMKRSRRSLERTREEPSNVGAHKGRETESGRQVRKDGDESAERKPSNSERPESRPGTNPDREESAKSKKKKKKKRKSSSKAVPSAIGIGEEGPATVELAAASKDGDSKRSAVRTDDDSAKEKSRGGGAEPGKEKKKAKQASSNGRDAEVGHPTKRPRLEPPDDGPIPARAASDGSARSPTVESRDSRAPGTGAGPAADGAGTPPAQTPPARKQKRKKKRKREGQKSGDADAPAADGAPATPAKSRPGGAGEAGAPASKSPTLAVRLPEASRMSTLQRQFLERLTSSRFRELNETLYTRPSGDSFDQFTANPELFDQYHEGFRKQAREWPVNPVDVIYGKIVKAWAHRGGGGGPVAVADFGCGDAKLAERLLALRVSKDGRSLAGQPSKRKGRKKGDGPEEAPRPFVVHSFDLVSGGNPLVTPADMSDVPLADGSVDVAVYSLALMGTNVADFVREAWRVLRFGGVLRVAEVRSRFETSSSAPPKRARPNGHGRHSRLKKGRRDGGGAQGGGDGGGDHPLMLLDEFLALLERCGFRSVNMDRTNKMFLFMDFVKEEGSSGLSEKESFTAKPCIYKRR